MDVGKQISCIVVALFGASLIGAGIYFLGNWSGASREEARAARVLKELESEKQNRQVAEKQAAELAADNERLRVQLKDGLELGEERKALATRSADLKRREELLREEATGLAAEKDELFVRVKATEQEYGESLHARQDYDRMRAERDAAQASKDSWLRVFVWLLSAAAVLLAGLVLVFSFWRHERHSRENELRHQVDVVRAIRELSPAGAGHLVGAIVQSMESRRLPG